MKQMAWVVLLLEVMVVFSGHGVAQTMSADEIVERVVQQDARRRAVLAHYESERTYQMDYKGPIGERHATMRVEMNYSAPDRKEFAVLSESGSTIFCHQILRKLMDGEREGAREANRIRSMLSPANDNLRLLGEEKLDGSDAWIIEVSPKDENRFNYKGKVWVNKKEFAVMRIVGTPAKNPTWLMGSSTFDYRYAPDGEFWLPQSNDTVSHLRIGGEITLKIDYGAYKVVAATAPERTLSTAANRVAVDRGFRGVQVSLPQ